MQSSEELAVILARLTALEFKFDEFAESIHTFLFSEEDYSPINRIHDKLDKLLEDETRVQRVQIAEKTLDKFEDYMKNVDKVNAMINEFKGCVALARAAIAEHKQAN